MYVQMQSWVHIILVHFGALKHTLNALKINSSPAITFYVANFHMAI